MIVDRFSKYLTGIEYPKEKTSWNIAGMIKGSNAFYRFDVREMFEMPDGTPAQSGRTDTKAQKMVLEGEKEWLILDLEELHEYIRREKKRELYINDLISDLEWTIFFNKKRL
jgi:hypothetical protein|tara:strand:+ start:5361 stop:5696 length:336 start_codon:yes stop_codon:yes gene_type:complete